MTGRQENFALDPGKLVEVGGRESNEMVHARTLVDWVGDCWTSGSCLDTVLRPGEGEGEVRCHRLVLGGVSRLLASIIPDTEEEVILILPGLDQADLQTFLRFVYTGAACVKSNSVLQLLHALRVSVPQVPPAVCLQHEGEEEDKLQLDSPRLEPQIFTVEQESTESDIGGQAGVNKELELFSCPVPVGSLHFESTSELSDHVASHLEDTDMIEYEEWTKDNEVDVNHYEEIGAPEVEKRDPISNSNIIKIEELSICDICGRNYQSPKKLKCHYYNVHMNKAHEYICKICLKTFMRASDLKIHSIIHSEDKLFCCVICDAKFKRSKDLKFHQKKHEGVKFNCMQCNTEFGQKKELLRHQREQHSAEYKNFNCKNCNRSFKRKSNCDRHSRSRS